MRPRLTATIVTPAPPGAQNGNRVTALRWAKRLRELGLRVRLVSQWNGQPGDVLVVLHGVHGHPSMRRHAEGYPASPRILALTGTDIYADPISIETYQSIEMATRVVALQPEALRRVSEGGRSKGRVLRQSATRPPSEIRVAPRSAFEVVALGHLRTVKDPFLGAEAVATLPDSSRVRMFHLGSAPDEAWRARADAASARSRGRWSFLGERPRAEALRILAGADLFVLTSVNEGGANVVTEAIACGVPILTTRNDGAVGILGDDHPGYFPVGDARALAALLRRCEEDEAFLHELYLRSVALSEMVDPSSERAAWSALLEEVCL